MDKILSDIFTDNKRWEKAIQIGVDKNINKGLLSKLCSPEERVRMAKEFYNGTYVISPPHTAKIPKNELDEQGNMKYRTVYINEPVDRILLSIINDYLFEKMSEMVHPRCKSYQTGIGCGKIVQEASRRICLSDGIIGFKSDLSKYFDSVPIEYIDKAFDAVEAKLGKSCVIDVVRKYYHQDTYFEGKDRDNLIESYQSLKQGCAVASWLADVILYHIDEKLSHLNGFYVRYSDDVLFIGPDYQQAHDILVEELGKMQLKVNAKKDEWLDQYHWFKFLGFSIKGRDISLSQSRIKTFQKEIEDRTIKSGDDSQRTIVNRVNRYLYKGFQGFSWATSVLPVINVKQDIDQLNKFVMDCIRGSVTGRKKVGGLGFVKNQKFGCINRGRGRNVTSNRSKTEARIEGYRSLGCMRNALLCSKSTYDSLVSSL